ncbi:hypothetical protein A2Y99_04545 [Candidatus Gottesmanbacteria bacterium RBG_13_37_7]|uniref:EamA domain-containing protein n=1 Tax=Candidatus Gottesmanbacteria bacterium RBG_13_37_7 TaxID=1798369 RepID=A0A1F5YGE6_9BACT|nr:MAG: hypothetical protein A2Y99_04545 [Candidatus Gottesmanbacteria bacterium RBG_13_37_7]
MSWQLALFFNIIFGTLRGTLAKKLVNKIDPFVMVFHMVYLSLPLYLFYYFFEKQSEFILYLEMMVLGIIFYFGYIAFLFAARISLSKSVVYSSYFLIITLCLTAIFLDEWRYFNPTTTYGSKNILGIIIAAVSLYVMFKSDSGREKLKDFRWLTLMLFNIITNGVGSFWVKIFLINHTPIQALFSQTVGILPASLTVNKIMKKNLFGINKSDYFLIIINSIFDFSALIFYYIALKDGPAMLVIPISTIALTISITLAGLIFFKEMKQFSGGKFFGLFLGILGVVLLVL